MPDANTVMRRCKNACAELNKRLKKYQQGLSALADDPAMTQAKIKKREVKLDTAITEAAKASDEMRQFLRGQYLKDYANAPDDDVRKLMDKWEGLAEKLLKEMDKMRHISNLLPMADAFFE